MPLPHAYSRRTGPSGRRDAPGDRPDVHEPTIGSIDQGKGSLRQRDQKDGDRLTAAYSGDIEPVIIDVCEQASIDDAVWARRRRFQHRLHRGGPAFLVMDI
jgi:hypothetical protein